jgi:Domain of unknown function (DUF3943)
MFRGLAEPNTMRFPATLSTRLRPVLTPPHRIAAALLFFALGVGIRAQTTAPSDPIPPMAPPVARNAGLNWNTGEGKSYVVPTYEVPGFLAVLSVYDRITIPHDVYDSTPRSTWEHLHEQHWVWDTDAFNMNQFAHPYQGATMFGFARSTGVSFWQSLIYSNAGSFIWKMAGETDLPSINDQLTTGTAGALLGESLFRMSSLLLEGGGEHPGFWRELGAAAISPPTGFNRLMFGGRFKAVFPSHDPAIFMRLRWGISTDVFKTNNLLLNRGSAYTDRQQSEAILDFTFTYGLPGKTGYEYTRPFDYFSFEFAGQTSAHGRNFVQDIMVRGLLYGTDYEVGENYRGIWGLYGSYDYIAPPIFRISSTAVSFGTTEQWWLSRHVAMQGSALLGVGFGAAGTIPQADGLRDYHYGATPQGLLALRFIFGRRTMLDFTARDYFVSGTGSDDRTGSEQIFRGNVGLTFRVFRHQALGLEYVESHRHSHYGLLPDRYQSEGTFSLVYTLLGGSRFGAVDWRKNSEPETE